jgi:hypothetical protein
MGSLVKSGHGGVLSAFSLSARAIRLLVLTMGELLANTRRFARAIAQVVELGAAHVALALDFDARDQRRVGLERSLDAFAARDLAHDERRIEAAVALGDDHAFVGLHALALAFDDVDVDDHGVARREIRHRLAQTGHFFLFQRIDDVHVLLLDQWFRPLAWRAAQVAT